MKIKLLFLLIMCNVTMICLGESYVKFNFDKRSSYGRSLLASKIKNVKIINNGAIQRDFKGQLGAGALRLSSPENSFSLNGPGDLASGTVQIYAYLSKKYMSGSCLTSAYGSNLYPQLAIRLMKDKRGWYLRADSRYWDSKKNRWGLSIIDNAKSKVPLLNKWIHIAYSWGKQGKQLWINGKKIAERKNDKSPIHQLWRIGIGDIGNKRGKQIMRSANGVYDNFEINDEQLKQVKTQMVKPPVICANSAVSKNSHRIVTSDGSLQVITDSTTGELLRINSMFPNPQNISQGLEVVCLEGDKEYNVGVNDGRPREDVPRECPVDIQTSYSIKNDCVTVNAKFIARRDVNKPVRLTLQSRFKRAEWPYIIYYTAPKKRYVSYKENLLWFGEDHNDLSRSSGVLGWKGGVPVLPFITLERNDRYIVAGPLNLNSSMSLTPNETGAYAPAVQKNPVRLKAGESYELSLTFGNVPRRGYGYKDFADALGWYMNHCYSTNRLTSDLFCWNKPGRYPKAEGNLWSHSGNLQKFNDSCTMAKWVEMREKCIEESFGKYIWLYGWHSMDETYPTKGKYYIFRNFRQTTVEDTRKEIRRLQAKGLKVCMYFRQFTMLELVNDKKPPYKSWLETNQKGEVITYDKGHSFPVPERLQKEFGTKKLTWIHLNFDNDDCRKWYIDQVKRVVEFYKPDGIAWDMAWSNGSKASHATMRIQADIYFWLKKNHPKLVVVGNGSGNPSSLFEDFILVENTQVGSGNPEAKSPLDYVATNAFKVAVSGVDKQYLIGYVAKKLGCDRDKLHIELSLRALGLGATIGYPMNYPQLKEAERFSATLTNMPPRMFGIKALPFSHNVDASLWAGTGKCRGAVFNNSLKAVEKTIEVPWEYLRMAGRGKLQLKWRLLGINGPTGKINKKDITTSQIWKGKIPAKTLLILTVESAK